MSIEEIAAQALSERKERRKNWPLYRQFDVDVLEELVRKELPAQQRGEVQEYLLWAKRERKATLEKLEKRGDFEEKSALPLSVGIVTLGTWALGMGNLPSKWHPWAYLTFYGAAAAVWLAVRLVGYRRIANARAGLAALGKVD